MATVIEFIVSPKGETTISVQGAKGSACHKLTQGLEESMGDVISFANTPEFYEEDLKTELRIERDSE